MTDSWASLTASQDCTLSEMLEVNEGNLRSCGPPLRVTQTTSWPLTTGWEPGMWRQGVRAMYVAVREKGDLTLIMDFPLVQYDYLPS